MSDRVYCKNCGFLSLRNRQTHELIEVDFDIRDSAKIPQELVEGKFAWRTIHGETPICFVRAEDLPKEYSSWKRLNMRADEAMQAVITNHGRNCGRFTDWQQGFTPKEHLEMIQQAELQRWQAEQAKENREFQAAQSAQARQHGNRSLAVSIAAVVVAVLTGMMHSCGSTKPDVKVYLTAPRQPAPSVTLPGYQ